MATQLPYLGAYRLHRLFIKEVACGALVCAAKHRQLAIDALVNPIQGTITILRLPGIYDAFIVGSVLLSNHATLN